MKTGTFDRWLDRAPTLPFASIMSGRRSHPRFAVLASPEGILRVMGDVVVQDVTPEQIVVLSPHPGRPGEIVSVRSPHEFESLVTAEVLESQPIVIDGSVRHQLRLRQTGRTAAHD